LRHPQDGAVADDDVEDVLARVGPRLRALRHRRGTTLAELAAATGFSISTLSRLESGKRRPTLELLIPLARVYRVPLDELAGASADGNPVEILNLFGPQGERAHTTARTLHADDVASHDTPP
jgi:transcriptional regulator with XRE-family HTH domain